MADTSPGSPHSILNLRLSRFLASRVFARRSVVAFLRDLRERRWPVFIFGGALRDLMVGGPSVVPRDIDLVVQGISADTLSSVFGTRVRRRTRFGGLHLSVDGWLFDVWPLADTWAFREGLVRSEGFSALPLTTFLNVEAVAAELGARGRSRLIHSRGFFEGIERRTLDINLEDNLFPALCVVRSLITAARLNFRLSPRLAGYISFHAKHQSTDALLAAQRSHYGAIKADGEELDQWIRNVDDQLRTSRRTPVTLPIRRGRQLELWHDAPASR